MGFISFPHSLFTYLSIIIPPVNDDIREKETLTGKIIFYSLHLYPIDMSTRNCLEMRKNIFSKFIKKFLQNCSGSCSLHGGFGCWQSALFQDFFCLFYFTHTLVQVFSVLIWETYFPWYHGCTAIFWFDYNFFFIYGNCSFVPNIILFGYDYPSILNTTFDDF